jgi:rod shape determining protein RodA
MADLVAGRAWIAERRPIRHVDWTLFAVVAGLIFVGLLAVYSGTNQTLRIMGVGPFDRMYKQLVIALLGAGVLIAVMAFDYRFLKVYAGFIYALTLFGLLLLRVPGVASDAGGTTRFIDVPGVSLMQISPIEFAKIGLIVILAARLSEVVAPPSLSDVLRTCAIAGLCIALVLLNVEIGTTIVLMTTLTAMLIVAGTKARHLAVLALAAAVMLFMAFQVGAIKEFQIERLTTFIDPAGAHPDVRYNLVQAEIAVGSGGLAGQGYLQGSQTRLGMVPEHHTDFIFTVVGEEFGFLGSVFVLSLFALLLWRAIRIAYLSKDPFGAYLAAGIAAMFAVQMFVNIGMVIGIMPITGIPLPFLSYGGTAMLVNLIAIGILQNVHMRRFT